MSFQLTLREWNYLAEESHSPKLTRDEAELLDKVDSGDVKGVSELLQNGSPYVNINCEGKRCGKLVTPLQIAAVNNDFSMIKLLLENGANHLDKPSTAKSNGKSRDILEDDSRLEAYHALCSPCYISQAQDDPIVTSMELSAELQTLSKSRDIIDTSKLQYKRLRDGLNTFR
ncbi:short transient receptor potential channel 6-like [Glandiceps talaboti]